MVPKAPQQDYSRADVRRQFRLTERQLKSWERESLVPPLESYSFSDLIAIRTIIELRGKGLRSRNIAEAVTSLRRKLDDVKRPLSELRILSDGRKIAVRVAGHKMEALTGQILFDFEAAELGGVRDFPDHKQGGDLLRESEVWFQQGLDLEETGAPVEKVLEAYQKVVELNPAAAGALVNLGTIHYRQRKFGEAERYYKQAIAADPSYPLAEFNLGNLYDEQGRLPDAFHHYKRTLALNPQYADAHFNLALLCERTGDTLKAVLHWKIYLKLDRTGQWAEIARRQLERLREATVIQSR